MIKNLFKVAIRNFIRERFYTFLNIIGLSVGITVAMLIVIYVNNELSYDRFHTKADRIHRLISHLKLGSNRFDGNSVFPPLALALKSDLPEVELAVRISQPNTMLMRVKDLAFFEERIFYVDPDFFRLFDFKLLAGEPENVLSERYRAVLTPSVAEKYFKTNDWQSIVGQSIQLGEDVFQVTGIAEDAPVNSHFHYNILVNTESRWQGRDETWNSMNVSTYFLLKDGHKVDEVLSKIPGIIEKRNPGYSQLANQGIELNFDSQPLTSIHLGSNLQGEFEPNSDMTNIYIFGAVALVVLILACVNFINLTTARSSNRAKEVGVRKVLGSVTSQLISQFTLESIIVVAIATLFALGLIELARDPFAMLTGKSISFALLLNPINLIILFLFIVVLGIIAGGYPSLFMASLKPVEVLKGKIRSGFKSSKLRNGLVTMQFLISIVLITATLIVQRQLDFMRSKKLGFDKENVVVVSNGDQLESREAFHNDLLQVPGVISAGASQFQPFSGYDGTVSVTDDDKETRKLINTCHVDYDYASTLKFEMVSGRGFSRDFGSDTSSVVINEVAAEYLFEGNPIGKALYLADDTVSRKLTVIGIVKNFNFQSLKNEVTPLVFILGQNLPYYYVRLNPGNYDESIAAIESLWKRHSDVSFDYTFYDEKYNSLFVEETKLGNLFSIFTGLALFIACLGLLGLAAYMSEQRNKELSIRKVLGASIVQIVILLSKDFTKLILIAAVIAFPIAYYISSIWLETYAYRIDLNFGVFVFAGVLVLVVALLTVSYQSIKAAFVNPVDSLKNE